MIIRLSKIVMLLSLSLFAFMVTFNNLTDYGSNYEFVRHVLSMDTTFPDNKGMYRALTAEWIWNAGYWLIIAGEGLTFVLLFYGSIRLIKALREPAEVFNSRKDIVVLGCTVGFLVWFVGFVVVGGEWFLMWQSSTWNGQNAAFRFYMSILGVLLFVMQPDREA